MSPVVACAPKGRRTLAGSGRAAHGIVGLVLGILAEERRLAERLGGYSD